MSFVDRALPVDVFANAIVADAFKITYMFNESVRDMNSIYLVVVARQSAVPTQNNVNFTKEQAHHLVNVMTPLQAPRNSPLFTDLELRTFARTYVNFKNGFAGQFIPTQPPYWAVRIVIPVVPQSLLLVIGLRIEMTLKQCNLKSNVLGIAWSEGFSSNAPIMKLRTRLVMPPQIVLNVFPTATFDFCKRIYQYVANELTKYRLLNSKFTDYLFNTPEHITNFEVRGDARNVRVAQLRSATVQTIVRFEMVNDLIVFIIDGNYVFDTADAANAEQKSGSDADNMIANRNLYSRRTPSPPPNLGGGAAPAVNYDTAGGEDEPPHPFWIPLEPMDESGGDEDLEANFVDLQIC